MTSAPAAARSGLGARRLPLAIATGVVVVDQLTKWWALNALDDRNIDLIGSLRFNLHFNTGAAFSALVGYGWILAILAFVMSWAVAVWAGRIPAVWPRVGLGLILGGAVGNLLDRIFRADDGLLSGAVIDFIDLQWFPIFNIADSAITVGVAVVLVTLRSLPAPEQ